jgi:glycerate kinase
MKFIKKIFRVLIALVKAPFLVLNYYKEQNKMAVDIATKMNEKFDQVNPENITQEEFSKELKELNEAIKPYADERKTTSTDLSDMQKSDEANLRGKV